MHTDGDTALSFSFQFSCREYFFKSHKIHENSQLTILGSG